MPDHALVGFLRIPEAQASPFQSIYRRVLVAVAALMLAVIVVYIDRDGYTDAHGGRLSLLDCIYYATVSLSTTGYGDITPVSPLARTMNILVITPLRILFLIVLVGTTLAVLTERSRQAYKIQRWRKTVRNHTVVVGYGTKGRAAVMAMIGDGVPATQIVVVDTNQVSLESAANKGLVTVRGDATRSDVLRLAGVPYAESVIVATNRDDTAVLVTLTARELSRSAKIVAAIREAENTHLVRQSGADSVVVSSETAGRLLGIATDKPAVVEMIEDLLTPDAGLSIGERPVEEHEVGGSAKELSTIVLGIVRGPALLRIDAPEVESLQSGDRLLFVRSVTEK